MTPEVTMMLEVQEIDAELLELKAQLAKYPAVWEKTKAKITAARNKVAALSAEKEEHQKNRRRIEMELRHQTDNLRRCQLQQPLVKAPREIEALTNQMEAVRNAISDLEREGLAELDREPTLESDIVAAKDTLAALEKEASAEKERIRTLVNEKKAEIESLAKRREAVYAKLDGRTQDLYERTFRRWPGSVVVPVRMKACSGCNFQLLQHTLVEVRRGARLQTCDNCGRVFSNDEDYVAGAAQD